MVTEILVGVMIALHFSSLEVQFPNWLWALVIIFMVLNLIVGVKKKRS